MWGPSLYAYFKKPNIFMGVPSADFPSPFTGQRSVLGSHIAAAGEPGKVGRGLVMTELDHFASMA